MIFPFTWIRRELSESFYRISEKRPADCVTRNFTYESVFHYIRSGLADFYPGGADLLENYVLATGVRGKRDGRRFLCAKTPDMENELEALEV